MRISQFLLATAKETPADAEIASHRLMLRAGMIRKLAAGVYSFLPLGMRVVRKIGDIVREEMNRIGALEILMPVVQPAELWQESGRWNYMGPELARFQDRHERDFCLGPTHEEVVTDIIRSECHSYRQLPVVVYQIQTKFRDERRPRFGVMRAREFIMKDAYSFHTDQASLEATYRNMHRAYEAILQRLSLDYRAVAADSGNIGGSTSHEFHVPADSGEDEIVFSTESDYAANIELATGLLPDSAVDEAALDCVATDTGDAATIDAVCELLEVEPRRLVKTLIVHAADDSGAPGDDLVALLLRGDQSLNETLARQLEGVGSPLRFADDETIGERLGCAPGCLGPVRSLGIPVIADHSVTAMKNFICGANRAGHHLVNANWERDCGYDEVAHIRTVREGDLSPDGKGTLTIRRGIEVGHIFQLGTEYSEPLNATVLNEQGRSTVMHMGCYGIGVTRLAAAVIEQYHDERGIVWPDSVAPFRLIIVEIDAHKSEQVREHSESLYRQAQAAGIEVLLDDRDRKTSPGVKFAESELIGIPHRLVVSPRALADGGVEYTSRRSGEKSLVAADAAIAMIAELPADS